MISARELSRFTLGPTIARFMQPLGDCGPVELHLLPVARAHEALSPRERLDETCVLSVPAKWLPMPAHDPESLVQLHVRGDPRPDAFAAGRTMRGGQSSRDLRLIEQRELEEGATRTISTRLSSPHGLQIEHRLSHTVGEIALRSFTRVVNRGKAPVTLEHFSAFSLAGITAFHSADPTGRLFAHRFRSAWSAEGRHECRSFEELQLERSWSGHGVACERFGQTGSMPVNGWFPFVAVEDRAVGIFWGAQLSAPGSWQLEIYRRGDQAALSGGLADREFGHWWKTLAPGEEWTGPEAVVACVSGTVDDLCDALSATQQPTARAQPAIEHDLPVIFNEWCTTWGNPTHENVIALADRLQGSGVRYLVIDDGWAERDPAALFQQNGDWRVNRTAFPLGLRVTCAAIRARGLVPGIWFEHEVVNAGTDAFSESSHQLYLDGAPLQVGSRRFWDFRDSWVHDYLGERLIGLLRDNEFGYLKIDYNATIGFGCDGAESPGEGLRQHLAGVQRFLANVRRELPDLVIENCSSGGHRLEPSFQSLCAMGVFSDAHETPEIPLIAANLHRLVLPRQTQVWAVLRRTDSTQRLNYSLAAGFLGRLCLSGEVHDLSPTQWDIVRRALALYREAAPTIAQGRWRRMGTETSAWRHATGWQAAVAVHENRALVVWHTFAAAPHDATILLPGGKSWHVVGALGREALIAADGKCQLIFGGDWRGGVTLLVRT